MSAIDDSADAPSDIAANGGAAERDGSTQSSSQMGLTQAVRWRVPVLTPPPAVALARNPSLPTFVGLIILILTFFIVLTSISIKDSSKSDAAMTSLQDAFSGDAVADAPPARNEEAAARDYFDGLTASIQSLVPLMGGKAAPASDHQVLWLPTELAFAGDASSLQPVFPKVLGEVVKALAGIPQRFTPHIEMRVCATEATEMVRNRAVAIGAALSSQRAPLRQFAIGIAPCDPTRIGIAIALAPAAAEVVP